MSLIITFPPRQAMASQHQPTTEAWHEMCAGNERLMHLLCVEGKEGGAVEQRKIRKLKWRGGQESSEADYTWRINTERHAKWQKYCNEKQLLIEIEGLVTLVFEQSNKTRGITWRLTSFTSQKAEKKLVLVKSNASGRESLIVQLWLKCEWC